MAVPDAASCRIDFCDSAHRNEDAVTGKDPVLSAGSWLHPDKAFLSPGGQESGGLAEPLSNMTITELVDCHEVLDFKEYVEELERRKNQARRK